MKRLIVIMNERGGVGKDTIINFVSQEYKCVNVSSIDPVKEVAKVAGWNGEKDPKSRKFLSDLKKLIEDYNDLPLNHLIKNLKDKFLFNEEVKIFFTCIRENYNIDAFKEKVKEVLTKHNLEDEITVVTMLVTRSCVSSNIGNQSDDNVEEYVYDCWYLNDFPLDETELFIKEFFGKLLRDSSILFSNGTYEK